MINHINKDRATVFVFGSNESGLHGAGAAKTAYTKYRAEYGVGFGPTGDSFAIPTKDWNIMSLPIEVVKHYVDRFIAYAELHSELDFQITRIGCGLAGFTDSEVSKLFPDNKLHLNLYFDFKWELYLPFAKFWGTF